MGDDRQARSQVPGSGSRVTASPAGRARHQLLKAVQTFGPTLLVQRAAPFRGKGALMDTQLSRLTQIAKRKRHDRFPIVSVRVLPSKRIGQARGRVDLEELPSEIEENAVRWLHRDSIATSDTQVELDTRSRESRRTPPSREQVGLGMSPEHEGSRRGQHTLQMQCQLVRGRCHTRSFAAAQDASGAWQTASTLLPSGSRTNAP